MKVQRLIEKGSKLIFVPFPALLSVTNTANTPRGPYLKGAMLAKQAEIKIFSIADLGLDPTEVGLNGSPTVVAKVRNVKSSRVLKKFEGHAETQVQAFFDALITPQENEEEET